MTLKEIIQSNADSVGLTYDDCLKQVFTLAYLKGYASDIGLTPDEVRQYGSLTKKTTWETAITTAESEAIKNISVTVNQYEIEPDTVNSETNDELPTEPTHTLINSSEWVEIENKAVSDSVVPIQGLPILPFTFTPTKPCKPDNSGYLVFDKKLGNWVKEKLSESSTPYRDKLIAKMSGYVGKGVTLDALEDMQKNPPDEHTAAIYLGLLEESERMLVEALVA